MAVARVQTRPRNISPNLIGKFAKTPRLSLTEVCRWVEDYNRVSTVLDRSHNC